MNTNEEPNKPTPNDQPSTEQPVDEPSVDTNAPSKESHVEKVKTLREKVEQLKHERNQLKKELENVTSADPDSSDDEDTEEEEEEITINFDMDDDETDEPTRKKKAKVIVLNHDIEELPGELESELKSIGEELSQTMKDVHKQLKKQFKNVTIRGVDAEVYSEFAKLSKVLGKTIGELVSGLMENFLDQTEFQLVNKSPAVFVASSSSSKRQKSQDPHSSLPKLVLRNLPELTISKQDLLETKRKLVIEDVKYVKILDDVDKDTFNTYIHSITGCSTIELPDHLPKLLSLAKCRNCEQINFYHPSSSPSSSPSDES